MLTLQRRRWEDSGGDVLKTTTFPNLYDLSLGGLPQLP